MTNTRIMLPILLLIGAVGAYWMFASNKPTVGKGSAPMVDVRVPDLTSAAVAGKQLFNQNCASCHGINAAGTQGVAPPLVHIIYEPNHHGDASFVVAVKNGVRAHHWPFGNMPPIDGVSEEEVVLIIQYVRELQRANGIF
ncbi:MAG: c-type cytochrome [Pseudomonadota bacterium]